MCYEVLFTCVLIISARTYVVFDVEIVMYLTVLINY